MQRGINHWRFDVYILRRLVRYGLNEWLGGSHHDDDLYATRTRSPRTHRGGLRLSWDGKEAEEGFVVCHFNAHTIAHNTLFI